MSIRTRLILLVVAVFIPIMIAALFGIHAQYQRERAAIERSMQETTRALALVVDGEIGKRETIARMLADSPLLDAGDFARFHAEASKAMQGTLGWVVLSDRERQIVNTKFPFGAPIPPRSPGEPRRFAFTTDRPVLTDLAVARLAQVPAASVQVPVRRGDATIFNVGVTIRPEELQRIVEAYNPSPGWVSSILDRSGTVIARVPDQARWVGKSATPDVVAAIAQRPSGVLETVTLDGTQVISAYNRSPVYGWTFIMGMPRHVLRQNVQGSLVQLVAVALTMLAVSVAIAIGIGRRIAAPIDRLRDTAARLERGEPVQRERTGIRECDEVEAALADASARIRSASTELEHRVQDAVATTEQVQVQLAAAQRLEALGRLTGGVAHDFNNLLAVINNNLFLVQNRAAGAAPELAAIQRAVNTGVRLTRQLLAFSRRRPLEPQSIALAEHLPGIVELIASSLGRHIELTVDIEPDLPPIEVDVAELELALINLAMNAKDAMAESGRLAIRARNAPEEAQALGGAAVALSVQDSGEGFPPEVLKRAFEPFFTTKRAGHGTGLGLSQVQSFCTQAGGIARIDSTRGVGTTVTMVLPAAPVEPPAERQPTARDPVPGTRVLLVDDNADLMAAMSPVLASFGFDVVTAPNADEALRALERESVDVVLSDVSMPGERNGLDLARIVRRDRPDLPVILMTGYTTELQRAVSEGFKVLQKPCAPDSLASTLRNAVAMRERA